MQSSSQIVTTEAMFYIMYVEWNPQNWGEPRPLPLQMRYGWPQRNMATPTCYLAKFGSCRSTSVSITPETYLKNLTPCDLSRSLEVIRTDMDRSSACYLLLMFHSTATVTFSYCFQARWRFQCKVEYFSHPAYLSLHCVAFPWNWVSK